ncbi:Serine/threonine protein kinase OSK1 (OsK1) (SUCROSE NON-FERMENTING-1 related protein kinase 1A) (SNF1-related kinase 1A) (SnRK1A) [Durusdinium trenchii]|uniref:Serine/threonine protein kinase OSK1 (OsK1) (SUCROSE NON-FERMENTING-1 related protein kinase 1A) (SNF1-related kinase 1A) (SnRK1A) n=1 Tax=Durusdinium trenchii TaxID=1381693 RepID=A0ABP0JFS7_9DINO
MKLVYRSAIPRPPTDGKKSEQSSYAKASRILEQHAPAQLKETLTSIKDRGVGLPVTGGRQHLAPIRNGSAGTKEPAIARRPEALKPLQAPPRTSGPGGAKPSGRRRSVTVVEASVGSNKSGKKPAGGRAVIALKAAAKSATGRHGSAKARNKGQEAKAKSVVPGKAAPSASSRAPADSMNGRRVRSGMRPQKTKSVGHYLIGDTLGEGTFGKVKRGTHTLTGETVAIKILEKSKIKSEADLTRVTREIKILKKTRHDNCIRLLEVIDTPRQIFLMMEFLEGGEVFDYIVKNQRLAEPEASQFFKQILDGVSYLHKINVIHRDLKPENLLMQRLPNGEHQIKVADFGLSNTNENDVLLKTACGSPCYAAPEMIAGKQYDGTKSDIWSLGVVLFALVCGFLPFEDDDTPTLYRKILHADYRCPSFVSRGAQDLLARILNTNPATRYTIEEVLAHPWMKRHLALSDKSQNQSSRSVQSQSSRSVLVSSPEDASENVTDPSSQLLELDERALKELEEIGIKRETVVQSMESEAHNSATASYFLVSERIRRDEEAKDLRTSVTGVEPAEHSSATEPQQVAHVEQQKQVDVEELRTATEAADFARGETEAEQEEEEEEEEIEEEEEEEAKADEDEDDIDGGLQYPDEDSLAGVRRITSIPKGPTDPAAPATVALNPGDSRQDGPVGTEPASANKANANNTSDAETEKKPDTGISVQSTVMPAISSKPNFAGAGDGAGTHAKEVAPRKPERPEAPKSASISNSSRLRNVVEKPKAQT